MSKKVHHGLEEKRIDQDEAGKGEVKKSKADGGERESERRGSGLLLQEQLP